VLKDDSLMLCRMPNCPSTPDSLPVTFWETRRSDTLGCYLTSVEMAALDTGRYVPRVHANKCIPPPVAHPRGTSVQRVQRNLKAHGFGLHLAAAVNRASFHTLPGSSKRLACVTWSGPARL